MAEETARGLEVLGATELAVIFREALALALPYWGDLGAENWSDWYCDSALEKAVEPLNDRAWKLIEEKKGVLEHWVEYARKHPDGVGV